jgi:hypothetical protein
MKKMLPLLVFACCASRIASGQATFPALLADGPAAPYQEKLMLFGQFVGDWDFQGVEYHTGGSRVTDKGEIEFAWVLQGRAVQDVWIERERSDGQTKTYGTTIRFYDPKIDAWRTNWIDPAVGSVQALIGRKVGDEIVLEGKEPDGAAIRWIFSAIKPNSFHWRSERFIDKSWRVTEECSVQRVKAVPR